MASQLGSNFTTKWATLTTQGFCSVLCDRVMYTLLMPWTTMLAYRFTSVQQPRVPKFDLHAISAR